MEKPTSELETSTMLFEATSIEDLDERIETILDAKECEASLVDDRIPVSVRKMLFSVYQSSIASLAIDEAARQGRVLAPWLSSALWKRVGDGLQGYLAFLASIQGVDAPVSVVPLEQRLNLGQVISGYLTARAKADADLSRSRANRGE